MRDGLIGDAVAACVLVPGGIAATGLASLFPGPAEAAAPLSQAACTQPANSTAAALYLACLIVAVLFGIALGLRAAERPRETAPDSDAPIRAEDFARKAQR